MVQSSPNLVPDQIRGREIQKSGSRALKMKSRTQADRQTPKIKNGPIKPKFGMSMVFDPRNSKIGVPKAKKQPLDLCRQTNSKNRKWVVGLEICY